MAVRSRAAFAGWVLSNRPIHDKIVVRSQTGMMIGRTGQKFAVYFRSALNLTYSKV